MNGYSKLVAVATLVGLILAAGCNAATPTTSSPASDTTAAVTTIPPFKQTQVPSATPQAPAGRNETENQLTATETPTRLTPTPTACLDEQAEPLELPAKRAPLKVRFISDGNVWAWKEMGGAARQISDTGDALKFTFSQGGEVIAFERPVGDYPHGSYKIELWGIDRDGGSLRRLVSAGQFDQLLPERHPAWMANMPRDYRWLPGTHQLTFGVYPYIRAIGGSDASVGYWVIDLDTLALKKWENPQAIDPYGPKKIPSPDGQKIVVVDRASISLTNANGAIIRKDALTYPQNPCPEGPCWSSPTVAWTPDSGSLRVLVWEVESFSEPFSVWQIPVDGSPAQKLATFPGMLYAASFSPNLKYLAYLHHAKPRSNEYELHLATSDGSQDILYASGYDLEILGWVPDSVHFVYDQFNAHHPFLGGVCDGARPLLDPPGTPAADITWVDGRHFLYAEGWAGQPRQLRLGQLGEPGQLIGSFNGDGAYYEVK
jgi:hypothetical protein